MKIRLPIDAYDLRARLFPSLIVSLPVLAFFYAVIPSARSFWGGVSGTVIEGAVLFVLMRIGRDRGAHLQEKLFKKWGGAPTTIMLRHRDNTLDGHTKERYKQTLSNLSGVKFPSEADELADPAAADALYDSAIRALREQRRRPTDKLVFTENCNYGFVRNLAGLKPIGLSVVALVLATDAFLYLHGRGEAAGLWFSALVSALTGVVLLLITNGSVKRTADAYAIAVLRTCDVRRAPARTANRTAPPE